MKSTPRKPMNLREGGMDAWEETDEYKEKIATITKEVRDKYSTMLAMEKSWIKRLILKLKESKEIRRRISELSSLRNLHAIAGPFMLN